MTAYITGTSRPPGSGDLVPSPFDPRSANALKVAREGWTIRDVLAHDEVVPILQERGPFHRDDEGTTLRDHLSVPAQYGLDPRLTSAQR